MLLLVDIVSSRSVDGERNEFLYFVGTPNFMAPEAQNNQVITDVKSDVWSLGGLLYQIATGGPPFGAPSEFLTFVRSNKMDLDIPCYLHPQIEACILQCLTLDLTERMSKNQVNFAPNRFRSSISRCK